MLRGLGSRGAQGGERGEGGMMGYRGYGQGYREINHWGAILVIVGLALLGIMGIEAWFGGGGGW